MATDTSVKFFTSADQGAPTLNGTAGSLIAVLDACLVNGYNLMAAQSLSVANGIATLSFASNHGYQIDQVIAVSGATPAALNGEQKVVSVTATSLTFATAVADGAATGSITAKYASAGWAKAFTGTNLAAYKSNDPKSTGMYLRVDDTGANNARVVGCEAMVDINTVTSTFPTEALVAGGLYWPKSNATDATARAWRLYTDGRTLYLQSASVANTYDHYRCTVGFGDILPQKSGDAYACFISGDEYSQTFTRGYATSDLLWTVGNNNYQGGFYLVRAAHGLGGTVRGGTYSFGLAPGCISGNAMNTSASNTPFCVFPNPADNGVIITPTWVVDAQPCARGLMPGMWRTPQPVGGQLGGNGALVPGQSALPGRTLHVLVSSSPNYSTPCINLIDVTGPWR